MQLTTETGDQLTNSIWMHKGGRHLQRKKELDFSKNKFQVLKWFAIDCTSPQKIVDGRVGIANMLNLMSPCVA